MSKASQLTSSRTGDLFNGMCGEFANGIKHPNQLASRVIVRFHVDDHRLNLEQFVVDRARDGRAERMRVAHREAGIRLDVDDRAIA